MRAAGSGSWRADLALAAVAFIWGATFVVVKEALRDASALLFLCLRFSLATAALVATARPLPGKFQQGRVLAAGGLVAGLCLFAGYWLQTLGLRYTTPSKSAFLTGLSIVMVPLLAAALHRRRPVPAEIAGVAAATLGMGLLTLEGGLGKMNPGDALTLGCAAGFALHILAVGHWAPRVNYRALTLVQVATATVLCALTFWWAEPFYLRLTPRVIGALVVTGLLATALAFSVQAWAQQRTTPTHTALMFALEPVFAWLTSFLVTGERLSLRQAGGAALILAGILTVELKPLAGARVSSRPRRTSDL
ncbi:MAG: DMT family transporter [Bryobacterales bacterium]|nr:DMT family transporter [Bryobacteraceae bacterium]MDW8130772.1 DMT family transporter [Bryobacterales bacterium]